MAVIEIVEAVRDGVRVVIQLAGHTGCGKTVTAIHLAYGLAGYDAKKIGFLDTENKRGKLNAEVLEKATRPTKDRFYYAQLVSPFSPARYAEAIHEFQKFGVEVLVIDSCSHEWEGTGGCSDIAESGKGGRWDLAKRQHKRFMEAMLQTDMHVIACVRAREKSVPTKKIIEGRERLIYEDLGMQPIQEKNFLFEATASLLMHEKGTIQTSIKVPDYLVPYLSRGEGYITADDGYAIRQWLGGGRQLDSTVEKFRNRLISVTENGAEYIKEAWSKTPKQIQDALGEAFYETIVKSGEGHDLQKSIEASTSADHEVEPDLQTRKLEAAIAKSAADAVYDAAFAGAVAGKIAQKTAEAAPRAGQSTTEDLAPPSEDQTDEGETVAPPAAPTPPPKPAKPLTAPVTAKPNTVATQERKPTAAISTPIKPPAQAVSRPAQPKDEPMF